MVKEWFIDLGRLIFPKTCTLCSQQLVSEEEHICSTCFVGLPQTNFHEYEDHALNHKFKGRLDFEQAVAMYYFNTAGGIQEIIHEIKYRNNHYLGEYMGKFMAKKLGGFFENVDVIVPVPLHPVRLAERGYNQSEILAKGLSQQMNILYKPQVVSRVRNTETQTNKTRMERFENMKGAFEWQKIVRNQHILLVDDVITTGATIESLVHCLPKEWNNQISILSLAAVIES